MNAAPPSAGALARLESDVWREACRHLDIEECVGLILPHVGRLLPVDRLIIRRIDSERAQLTTVASAAREGFDVEVGPARGECPPALLHVFHHWLAGGRATGFETASNALGAFLMPAGLRGSAIAGPLRGEGGGGVLVLIAAGAYRLGENDLATVQALLDPIAVALENDRRLAEMDRMREALEADRRALLTRLDRTDLGEAIIGDSTGLRGVMTRVEQVAPTDVPVLILGETGSGKEVIARAIHARSRRSTGPVVRVNCGAIPSELVDSELFGHEKGSFTGATQTRKGWFERADGGTLFLDEIGELPMAAQVRLLRVLQDGTLERVGGQRPLTVDVRIVAATHRNLEHMVAAGGFREDLWYRIGVFPIRLPGLRERPDDIPALAAHFGSRAGQRLGAGPLVPTEADLALLRDYPWPGNVRELAAVIERAAILGDGRRLEIGLALGTSIGPKATAPVRSVATPEPENGAFATLDEAMVAHIQRALQAARGRIEGPRGAAKMLGINPHTLRAKMRKLDLDWSRFRDDL